MPMLGRLLVVLVVVSGCRDATGKESAPAPAAAAPTPAPALESSASLDRAKQGQNAEEYVPAEFKNGMSRWKDTGVYVDGKPIAFLQFGELPITLQPTWVKDKVSQNKPANCPECLSWKWSEARFYKFTDYLKALGIDPHKIKMMHVYGPKLSQTIAVSAKDLLRPDADEFMFRFGAQIAGKPIPHVPPNFGNGKQPDKINGVMIYINKKPPTITRDGVELDGVDQTGVPYYGEPLRGGVRIYLDDHLVSIIKRQELDVKKAITSADGELHWSLADFLTASGVDTSKVVEGWVIRDDRRHEQIPWSDLSKMTFSASSKAHGGVLLGDKEIVANAIALHTRAIKPDELPVIKPDEEP
jgi:hypothetical protein